MVITSNLIESNYRKFAAKVPVKYIQQEKWYSEAKEVMLELSDQYDLPVETVTAITAVLSPNIEWNNNINAAISILDCQGREIDLLSRIKVEYDPTGGRWQTGQWLIVDVPLELKFISGYHKNKIKALKILLTGHSAILSGPKVTAFYNNLMGNQDYITVDSHMARIAVGGYYPPKHNLLQRIINSHNQTVANIISSLADELGIAGSQLQAALWTYAKSKEIYA